MSRIQAISTTRVTDSLTRGRLTSQIQSQQLDLFKLQNQITTGRRIILPSDDAAAAQRASVLQRTIERKTQSATNLQGAQAALSTTEAALAGVNNTLAEIKSQALSVIGTQASSQERAGVIEAIDEAIDSLTRVGNASFATNFLLGGAERSSVAYRDASRYVEFLGDESSSQTFVDLGLLFDQGVSGDDVLGGLSEAVRGSGDLNAQLTPATPLARLNGGAGVSPDGSIEVTYIPALPSQPSVAATIDLSSARSIDDVARLIEAGAPADAGVTVSVQGSALRLEAAAGTVSIGEVGGGRTAAELGINTAGANLATVAGADLDPTIDVTTRLGDLVGSRARGRIVQAGDNNDLVLTADRNGADLNGLRVFFNPGGVAGSEGVVFAPGAPPTLTVTIDEGASTAATVASAINAAAGVPFTATPDHRDQTSFAERGRGELAAASGVDYAVGVAGGVNGDLDLAAGLRVTNGAETFTIDTSAAETVEDLLGLFNDATYGLVATINATRDGIDIRSRRSGADFAIAENGGQLATQLGVRTYTEQSLLADFNLGSGVVVPFATDTETRAQNRFTISVRNQGATTEYAIDPVGLTTVQSVIDRISAATGGAINAALRSDGNGLVLTRSDAADAAAAATGSLALAGDSLTITADGAGPAGNTNFTVEVVDSGAGGLASTVAGSVITVDLGGSAAETTSTIAASIDGVLAGYAVASSGVAAVATPAGPTAVAVTGGFDADEFTVSGGVAERLGFVAEGTTSATSTGSTLSSTDRNPREVNSAFTTLIRLRDALREGDDLAFERFAARLDEDIDRVSFGRAEVGVRLRNLESVAERLEDEEVTLREALSDQIDADLVEVVSDYTAQQVALQASLQTAGTLLNLSILDFL